MGPRLFGRSASFGGGSGVSLWQVHELNVNRLTATAARLTDRQVITPLVLLGSSIQPIPVAA
jgi:hypothetical protein